MQKSSTKHWLPEFNSTLKESYIIIKFDLSLGCKDNSTYAN